MSLQGEMSLDELSSIMNLQRQEAFDDTTEALHKSMSKRGSLVTQKSGSARPEGTSGGQAEKAEEMLLRIIMKQTPSSNPSENKSKGNCSSSVGRRDHRSALGTAGPSGEEKSRQRSSSTARGGSSRKPDTTTKAFHSSMGNMQEDSPSRPPSHSRHRSRSQSGDSRRDQYKKSQSVGNINPGSSETDRRHSERRRSSARSKSPSRDAASVSSSERRGKRPSLKRPPTRAVSAGANGSAQATIAETGEGPQSPTTADRHKSRQDSLRGSKGRSSRRVASGINPTRSHSADETMLEELTSGNFEQLWSHGRTMTTPPGNTNRPKVPKTPTSAGSKVSGSHKKLSDLPDINNRKDSRDADSRSLGSTLTKETISLSGRTEDSKLKKTKLEKIHELQAKCDRYKTEWLETAKEKKRLRKELQDGKSEILSLTKAIDTHTAETAILQKKLSENLQKLDELQDEQRKERNDFSTTAKELAESRIEFTKALNETRELRMELEKMEETLRAKDLRITDVEDDLKESKIRAEDLDSDLNFAEETVLKLEKEIRLIQEELVAYRAAADKGSSDNGENMRKVRDDMEKRLFEDREQRLVEKQKKLEEKIHQFEDERERFVEKEKEREQEIEERIRQEAERNETREAERTRLDDDIHGRLQALEEDNTALQGRLKCEQLDSNVKLRQKDEHIESLQKELTIVQGQLAELGSDPNGAASLKKEVDAAKSEANALKDELEEVQKHNSMLTDEIEELQAGAQELQTQMKALQQQVATHKKEAEVWQRKSSEWEAKSGEWTDKAYLWKEKAEQWEKIAKDTDPAASDEPEAADPQALFLQAAVQRRQAFESTKAQGSKWAVIGNFLGARTTSEATDDGEAQERIQELQADNAKQAEIINNLRSEMMKMQGNYKEQVYNQEQKMQELIKERDTVATKNANLMKELELARKLESLAAQDMM